jgi:hypothetical protein
VRTGGRAVTGRPRSRGRLTGCLLTLGALLAQGPAVSAECVAHSPRYAEVGVRSCSAAREATLAKIERSEYSDSDFSRLEISMKYVTLVEAVERSDADIIYWYARESLHLFKGPVTPIPAAKPRRYMIIGTTLDSCEEFYAGKTFLASVQDPFRCCRDVGPITETAAQCLLELPAIGRFGIELDELPGIGIPLPGGSD